MRQAAKVNNIVKRLATNDGRQRRYNVVNMYKVYSFISSIQLFPLNERAG